EVDADLSYLRGTWARDFKAGDRLSQDASLQVRLWPRTLAAAGVPSYLYGVLEAANVYQAEDEAGGARDADSGGYQLFVTPGLQWVTERAVVEAAVQVPAVQRLNGGALRSDFNLLGGFRVWL
ncbi:MAG: transporter, partial [Elusimicrobia bacterium]|nr:transporter [Elusimicrobiota bacterium]